MSNPGSSVRATRVSLSEQLGSLCRSNSGSSIRATLVILYKESVYPFADHTPGQDRSSSLIFTRTHGRTETLCRRSSPKE